MAYFLKIKLQKKVHIFKFTRVFMTRKGKAGLTALFKALGYVHELQAKGIDDPISFYKEEVIRLNQEANAAKAAKSEADFR